MNHLKQKNETQFEYMKRLTFNRKELGLSYSQWAKLVADYDCSDDNGRKILYGVRSLLLKLEDELEDGLKVEIGEAENLQELIQELEEKKIELIKEKVKLQDQRRSYLSLVRTEARWEALIDDLRQSIQELSLVKPLSISNEAPATFDGGIASLLISDLHIGMTIDSFANKYNFDIAQERFNFLASETIKYCELHKVSTLNVEILGDLIHGLIHVGTRINQQDDVIRQITLCAELLSEFITCLSQSIPNIVIHFAVGNHSRINAAIKESLASENFEYLILWYLKSRLENLTNVSFSENLLDKEIAIYNVFDKTICSCHGHREKKVFDSVSKLSKYLGIHVDEVHVGHFHNFSQKDGVIINGSFCGLDQFALEHRYSGKPEQTLKIYHQNGSSCVYNIVLI